MALYWAIIFLATHLPKSTMPSLEWSDKLYHCAAFSGLSFLIAWAIPCSANAFHSVLVLSISAAYAILDEVTQQLIPGRTYDFWDICVDCLGACLGIAIYAVFRNLLIRTAWGRTLIQTLSQSLRVFPK